MESKGMHNRHQEAGRLTMPTEKKSTDEEPIAAIVKVQQKLEYDFDQLVQKHNESLAQINDIRDKVNGCRAERVIYSGVFRNIEREIRLMEE
jgi:hypothetical protein